MSEPPRECDVAVVGGGILGMAVTRELLARRPGARVCVLEGEDRIGRHQTGRSSGVIHAGIYYEPGSLKARLCVEGARELYEYCDERGVAYERSGKLVVAVDEGELPRLDELERRGRANGVPGLRRLGGDEIAEIEPAARGVAALHSPNTGVVDFVAVAEAYAADVRAAGGTVHLGAVSSGPRRDRAGSRSATPTARASPPRRSSAPGSGPTASPSPVAPLRTLASSPSAVPTCACGPPRRIWSAPTSTPSPTRSCPSSAPT